MKTALRQKYQSNLPLDLQNGDLFDFWRTGSGNTVGSYKGSATCLGMHRSLVVGFQGGHFITAHVSRCRLNRRGPHYVPTGLPQEIALQSVRERGLEEPLPSSEAESCALLLDNASPAEFNE
jgi:hypothetical protein